MSRPTKAPEVDRPYIQRLLIQDFGCIRDLDLQLSPLHALIGPNDSGKSTILRALRTLASVTSAGTAAPEWSDFIHLSGPSIEARIEAQTSLGVVSLDGASITAKSFESGAQSSIKFSAPFRVLDQGHSALMAVVRSAQMFRLDADALRSSSGLIPDGSPVRLADERGTGLPSVYDAIQNRDLDRFIAISTGMKDLFPNVKSLQLKNPSGSAKAIAVELVSGETVPAAYMSEGLLYYLAFAAIASLAPTAMILVEEPENGLHPSRIADVMKVLRHVSRDRQVIIATHSPLVLNELEPHEVSVVTRTVEHGTKAVLMRDTPNFEKRSAVYSLGELWVSYANGSDEKGLTEKEPQSGAA